MNTLPHLIPGRVRSLLAQLDAARWVRRADVAVTGGPVNERPILLTVAQGQSFNPVAPGWSPAISARGTPSLISRRSPC